MEPDHQDAVDPTQSDLCGRPVSSCSQVIMATDPVDDIKCGVAESCVLHDEEFNPSASLVRCCERPTDSAGLTIDKDPQTSVKTTVSAHCVLIVAIYKFLVFCTQCGT